MYLFLKHDLEALKDRLRTVRAQDTLVGEIIGESMSQSSETYHDNFDFEQGKKERLMLGESMMKLKRVLEAAQLYEPPRQIDKVDIGSTVLLEDLDRSESFTVTVGSFVVDNVFDGSVVSYASPLGELLLGSAVGDKRELVVGDYRANYRVGDIRQMPVNVD